MLHKCYKNQYTLLIAICQAKISKNGSYTDFSGITAVTLL
ncbi:hypothetical protein CLOSTHATH_00075 [Hungatella hathewayi DSM 13479]|uniref:Uncharacterized protein n=1 Tax=Hungatella hathewayi DSM 13479 TaxID=566550 RepID=D3A905_9FIRM|nr:hypothetical protein CLOSTHATH_00075 [Hungatella hathewayi DSM 13479]